MSYDGKLIQELNFIVTHPSVSVEHIEAFYNNCLMTFDTVPILMIIDHLHKINPGLLKSWASYNKTIGNIFKDMDYQIGENNEQEQYLTIKLDLSEKTPNAKGYYKVKWISDIGYDAIKAYFKRKALRVKSIQYGDMVVTGLMDSDENNIYYLYLKKVG